jgi:hypothetical protein
MRVAACAGLLGLLAIPAALACESAQCRTGLPRLAQERPFGGPLPPRKRSLEKAPLGRACKTPAITCKLPGAQPLGDACSCPGSDGKPITGTVVEHPG